MERVVERLKSCADQHLGASGQVNGVEEAQQQALIDLSSNSDNIIRREKMVVMQYILIVLVGLLGVVAVSQLTVALSVGLALNNVLTGIIAVAGSAALTAVLNNLLEEVL